jgi:hypothetical protein
MTLTADCFRDASRFCRMASSQALARRRSATALGTLGNFPSDRTRAPTLNSSWKMRGVKRGEWKNSLFNLTNFEWRQAIVLGWRELPPIGRRERFSNGSPNGCERWFRKSRRQSPRERSRVVAGNSHPVGQLHTVRSICGAPKVDTSASAAWSVYLAPRLPTWLFLSSLVMLLIRAAASRPGWHRCRRGREPRRRCRPLARGVRDGSRKPNGCRHSGSTPGRSSVNAPQLFLDLLPVQMV